MGYHARPNLQIALAAPTHQDLALDSIYMDHRHLGEARVAPRHLDDIAHRRLGEETVQAHEDCPLVRLKVAAVPLVAICCSRFLTTLAADDRDAMV